MDEQEAEAVLLALVQKIEWQSHPGNIHNGHVDGVFLYRIDAQRDNTDQETGFYGVGYHDQETGASPHSSDYPSLYASLTAAKIACEHYATRGYWDWQLAVTPPADPADPEAESALLALGPQLKWGIVPGATYWKGVGHGVMYYAQQDIQDSYVPSPHPWKVARLSPGTESCPAEFPTATRARLACERHHATGKWE